MKNRKPPHVKSVDAMRFTVVCNGTSGAHRLGGHHRVASGVQSERKGASERICPILDGSDLAVLRTVAASSPESVAGAEHVGQKTNVPPPRLRESACSGARPRVRPVRRISDPTPVDVRLSGGVVCGVVPRVGIEHDCPRIAADLLRSVDGLLRPSDVNTGRVHARERVYCGLNGYRRRVERDLAGSFTYFFSITRLSGFCYQWC